MDLEHKTFEKSTSDYIELYVYGDGDIALIRRQEPSLEDVPGEAFLLPQKDVLTYGVNQVDELKAELLEYGCETNVIDRCVAEALNSGYGEETFVK